MANLEAQGVPGVFVATAEFVDGAQRQAAQIGVDPAGVFVEHPIQDRSDEEMLSIADRALSEILEKLVESAG